MNTKIFNEVNQALQSHQFEVSGNHILYGRLHASNLELRALNNGVETLLTDYLAADDYDMVMEYDDAPNSMLALLEHDIDMLKACAMPSSSVPP